ncbi:MAG: hypothetical protein V1674_02780 [Candidatus Omnitrophota bacterium]
MSIEFKPRCLATGIGSLPHKDAPQAVDLILRYSPEIPFWPQLPKISLKESMTAQFSENLPGIEFKDKGIVFNASTDKDEALSKFYEKIIAVDTDYFAVTKEFASGLYAFIDRLKTKKPEGIELLKGQSIGPFTLAASIKQPDGRLVLNDPLLMDAVVNGLGMKAYWQIKQLKNYCQKVIIFFDEPYLGCFGSGFTPVTREEVIKRLNDLIEPLRQEKEVFFGVHCCGNTDWSMLMEAKLDIISFDAFGYLERLVLYGQDLKKFFERGGILAWGIIPTSEFKDQSQEELIARFEKGLGALEKKGISKDLVLERSLITPSCGMATLSEGNAEEILRLASQVSGALRKKYF